MKIRNGFVSNSSSSSFVVMFPKRPKSIKEVMEILFGDESSHEGYPTSQIAESIFNLIKQQEGKKKLLFNKTVMACIEVQGDTDMIIDKFFPDCEDRWDLYERIEHLKEGRASVDLISKHPNEIPYVFHFSDEDGGYWAMMEHSDIFNKLPYERTSHH